MRCTVGRASGEYMYLQREYTALSRTLGIRHWLQRAQVAVDDLLCQIGGGRNNSPILHLVYELVRGVKKYMKLYTLKVQRSFNEACWQ